MTPTGHVGYKFTIYGIVEQPDRHCGDDLVSFRCFSLSTASEIEVVESRLRYEIVEDPSLRVAAEFLCYHGDSPEVRVLATPTIEVRGLSDPEQLVSEEPVRNASQRRWVVRKVYVDRGLRRSGLVTVERWSVRSYVDYTCSAGH